MKKPLVNIFPNFTTENGKEIWNGVIKRRKADIRSTSNLKRQWAIAILLYRRSCARNHVMPFTSESYPSKSEIRKVDKDKLVETILRSNRTANDEIDDIFTDIGDHARKLTKQVFEGSEYSGGLYTVSLRRKLFLQKDVPPAWVFPYLVGKHEFMRTDGYVVKPLSALVDIVVKDDRRNKYQMFIIVQVKMTRNQAEMISESKGSSTKDILSSLGGTFRKWLKRGKLPKRREKVSAEFKFSGGGIMKEIVVELEDIGEFTLASKLKEVIKGAVVGSKYVVKKTFRPTEDDRFQTGERLIVYKDRSGKLAIKPEDRKFGYVLRPGELDIWVSHGFIKKV